MDFELSGEQREIRRAARDFARGEFDPERAIKWELEHTFPRELYARAGELGFIGLDFAEEFGGSGYGVLENLLVIEEFCKRDSGIGMALHLGFLPAKIIKLFGTAEQKRRFLAPLARGESVSAISLTEPDHGSDITTVQTTLTPSADGLVLNGVKVFTTNAAYADFFVVLSMDQGHGLSTLIVDRHADYEAETLQINEIPYKMGLKMTSSGEVIFKNFPVPEENILGPRGHGLAHVLGFLDESRVEIGAQALGAAQGAFMKALRHTRSRQQFGRNLIEFQAVGHHLARMLGRLQACKFLGYYAAWLIDQGRSKNEALLPLITSIVKYFLPEESKKVIDQAINLLGGYGYFLEQEVERRYRDSRITEIYEGTVEVQLNNITRLLKTLNPDFIDQVLL